MIYLYRPIGLFYYMQKGENTRQFIIEKSAELFKVNGYNGCSLSDIMNATQLKKGGIYNHFNNKDEIALEAFEYSLKQVIKRFRAKLDHDKTSTQKLYSIIEVFCEMVNEGGCPIYNTAVDSLGTHPLLQKHAKKGMDTLKDYIEIKIKEGKENGEFKPDADSVEISSILMVTLEGALIMSRIQKNKKYLNIAVDFLHKYLNEKLILNPE